MTCLGETIPARVPFRLSHRASAGASAVTVATFLAGAAAPTPLYGHYEAAMGFGPSMLTVIFAAYASSLLAALLVVGSLSDHIGRRPTILAAIALDVVAMSVFARVGGPADLVIARLLQGFATGMATTALGAAIVDVDHARGPLINSVTTFAGLFAGALGSGLLVVFAPFPTVSIYAVLIAVSLAEAAVLVQMPETSPRLPGAWRSLIPEVRLPRAARRAFLHSAPVNVAGWALGGFNLSLVPSVVRATTGSASPLLGASVVGTLVLAAVAAVVLLRRQSPQRGLLVGALHLVGGMILTLVAVRFHAVGALFFGIAVAGFGFGAELSGAMRNLLPLATADERAGLLAAFYVESYLAFGLPVVLAGVVLPRFGLAFTTEVYGSLVVVLALSSFMMLLCGGR